MTRLGFALTFAPAVVLLSSCASPPPIDHSAEHARLARELYRYALEARWRAEDEARRAELMRLAEEQARRKPRPAPVLVASMRPGQYHCDLARTVELLEVDRESLSAVVRWQGRDYPMQAVRSPTGALRLEDPHAGLVWLTILGKSILLDARDGRQLANDCNPVS